MTEGSFFVLGNTVNLKATAVALGSKLQPTGEKDINSKNKTKQEMEHF